jgi:hypothetical protein
VLQAQYSYTTKDLDCATLKGVQTEGLEEFDTDGIAVSQLWSSLLVSCLTFPACGSLFTTQQLLFFVLVPLRFNFSKLCYNSADARNCTGT